MSDGNRIQFARPPRQPTRQASFRVPLLQSSKVSLSVLNQRMSEQQGWRFEPAESQDKFLSIASELNHGFCVIEVDLIDQDYQSIAKLLELTGNLTQTFSKQRRFRKHLAIVGRADIGQDKSAGTHSGESSVLDLHKAFRTAGAVWCGWHRSEWQVLIGLINRFAESLPAEPIGIEACIFDNLPWPKFAFRKSFKP